MSKDDKRRLSHIRLLFATALADGKLDKTEEAILAKIAQREGVSEKEVLDIINRKHINYIAPEDKETKRKYLIDIACIIMADGKITPEEINVLQNIAKGFGFSLEEVKSIIDEAHAFISGNCSDNFAKEDVKQANVEKQSFQASQENQPVQKGLKEVKDPNLLYALAMHHFSQHEYGDAVCVLKNAGENGSVDAMNMLGVCYENGYGVPVKRDLAIKNYTVAAEKGLSDAQFNLGRLYYIIGNEKYRTKGPGGVFVELVRPMVPYEEDALAEKWFRAAAEQGNEKAQFGLGELLMGGIGVERSTKNYEEGVNWMKKSAANGFKPAIDYVEAKKL